MFESILTIVLFSTQSVFSPHGQYQGIIEYASAIDLTTVSFTLTNAAGDTLYTKTDPEPITFYVTDDATVFATNETKLFFYRQNGRDTLLKNLNFPNGFGFSPDHSLFFASDRNEITAYCSGGKLQLRLKPARLFASSDRGSKIATVSNDTLVIYHEGKEKHVVKLATPFIHELKISPDGQTIYLKEPVGKEIFDVDTGLKLEEQ
jgi:sugar lactone lactonase YvrE